MVEEGEYPQWFFNALTDPTTYDAMLRQAVKPGGDWGTAAEFQRYHETVTDLNGLHIKARELQAHIDSLRYQEEQCCRRLLASHKYKSYALFHKLHDEPLLRGDKGRKFSSIPHSSRRGAAHF
jgi:DNA-directed RNA polymerase subunit N (RpoN/RPB10)